MKRKDTSRITVTVTPTLLSRIDAYAESLAISRAAAVSVLCSSMLNSIDLTDALREGKKKEDAKEG
jgi:hypothetical protein